MPATREVSSLESMPPSEWGLPGKFNQWRPGQAHMVEDIVAANTQFVACCSPTGCVSGETLITIGPASAIDGWRLINTYSIAELHRATSGLTPYPWGEYGITALLGDKIGLQTLDAAGIIFSGRRITYRLLTNTGKSLRATLAHLIRTPDGWKELGDLEVGDPVLCHAGPLSGGVSTEYAESVTYYGEEDTFDACCRDPHHNFVANGIIVHNSGKSPGYVTAAKIENSRAIVLTSTKGLQDQLIKDFSDCGMVDIRGKSNYECSGRHGLTCEEAWSVCKAKSCNECPYQEAYKAACEAPLAVTNYSCWLNRNKMGNGAFTRPGPDATDRPFGMLILDEAHDAPEELAGFMAFEFTNEDMVRHMGSQVPKHTLPMAEWKDYAKNGLPTVKLRVADMESGIKAGMRLNDHDLRDYNRLTRIKDKLGTLATCNPDMWTVEPNSHGFHFDPVWPGNYSHHLFQGIPKVVLMSATLRPKTMYLLGLKDDQFTFNEYPSPFNVNDSPIYHIPTARLNKDSGPAEVKAIYARIDQIIRGRLDRKGIVHSVSYPRALDIRNSSEYRDYMLLNEKKSFGIKGLQLPEVLEQFRKAKPPSVLVSPSVATGFDFPGNLCEYNIIPKLPFPDSRSTIMKERLKRDPEYSNYLTAQKLVQMCGRGNRFVGDRCQNFILDDSIKWFAWRMKHLFPKFFFDMYRTAGSIPAPLPPMNRQ